MSDDAPADSRTGHSWAWFSLWSLLVFLLLYVLTTGPVIRGVDGMGVNQDFLMVLYAPLIILSDNIPMVQQFFEWYVEDVWGAH